MDFMLSHHYVHQSVCVYVFLQSDDVTKHLECVVVCESSSEVESFIKKAVRSEFVVSAAVWRSCVAAEAVP